MNSQRMDLYCLSIRVSPTLDHPQFIEFARGILTVWLFGSSWEDAKKRASAIVSCLPYEMHDTIETIHGGKASEVRLEGPDFEDGKQNKACENLAVGVGLALLLWHNDFGAHNYIYVSFNKPEAS